MEDLGFKQTDEGIQIDRSQFPDSVRFIGIGGEKAKRLADLHLHREDLRFVAECLDGINLLADNPRALRQGRWRSFVVYLMKCLNLRFAIECLEKAKIVAENSLRLREGLWHSAIVHFMKCFGGSVSRARLNPESVYKDHTGALEVFKYFKALRDKHLVHDENSYAQCLTGAVLNRRECDNKIAKIICSAFIGNTLDQTGYSNLRLLTAVALKWVEEQIDDLCDLLALELQAVPYDDLFCRKEIVYSFPKIEEIDTTRATP